MFGTGVGICALHGERGVQVPKGSQRASAGCASMHGTILLALGKEDVTGIFAVGGENALWDLFPGCSQRTLHISLTSNTSTFAG